MYLNNREIRGNIETPTHTHACSLSWRGRNFNEKWPGFTTFFLAQIDYTFFGQCTAILYNNWNFHVGIFLKSI